MSEVIRTTLSTHAVASPRESNIPSVTVGMAMTDTVAPASSAADGQVQSSSDGHQFELVEELGRGGMGAVYRARQLSLERDVAIKVTLGNQRADTRARFISEARVTGYLQHPNIVPVYDLGKNQSGEYLLAMKRVRGQSLHHLLHQKDGASLSRSKAFEVFFRVCDAIAYAHARDIVHCDIKPENIMVGEFGEVLVMDWGIAVDLRSHPTGPRRGLLRSEISGPLEEYLHERQSRRFLTYCFGFLAGLAVLGVLVGILLSNQLNLEKHQIARHRSNAAAFDLQRSSDELTSHARAFVMSAEPEYRQSYDAVLTSLHGEHEESALLERLQALGTSPTERELIEHALTVSKTLAKIEMAAMSAVERSGQPAPDIARQQLFGPTYRQAQRDIMTPIAQFRELIDRRTRSATEALETRGFWLLALVIGLLAVLGFAAVAVTLRVRRELVRS